MAKITPNPLLILNHPPTPFFEKEGGLTQVFPLFFKEGIGVISKKRGLLT